MRRNLVDVSCAIAIVVIAIFLMLKSDSGAQRRPTEVEVRPTRVERWKSTGTIGILQFLCLALGVVKLVRCAVETRESKLGGLTLLSEIRTQLGQGQIDHALSQAKSDSGYAGRVLAGALSRQSGGGDVRRGFEDAGALESSRLHSRVDTLLLIGVVGFLLGLYGAVSSLTTTLLFLLKYQSPTLDDASLGLFQCLTFLTYGTIIALVFVPAFLVMKRRVSMKVSKVNVELGVLLDRAALQK